MLLLSVQSPAESPLSPPHTLSAVLNAYSPLIHSDTTLDLWFLLILHSTTHNQTMHFILLLLSALQTNGQLPLSNYHASKAPGTFHAHVSQLRPDESDRSDLLPAISPSTHLLPTVTIYDKNM